ncbi:hypothetical protein HHK36_015294 [Tetracentron sinense]|uniref:Protein kinase domain-containing protein n=1 Tax=Tetracentron sinense TaxID=13715 RepID=A0A834Z0J7_TETSI|nr:hypothetical protein HHK36_015294 [Tetracentron sinense]
MKVLLHSLFHALSISSCVIYSVKHDQICLSIGHVSPIMRLGAYGLPPYHVFTLEEIEEATNNFDPSNLMGEGSQGQLYKAWLRDGSMVLVRCLKLKQRYSPQSLLQHMEVVSKLRHRHLVSILGHCIVTYQDHPNAASTLFLVFEYVSNGALRSHLTGKLNITNQNGFSNINSSKIIRSVCFIFDFTDWRKREMLKWPQRVAVTIGVARGIEFLHTGIAPGIYGNGLKMDNILLDENLTAKICSYNLPMSSRVGSESPFNGVEPPEHLGSVEHTEKDDIYQLGIILLEVVMGKPITSQSEVDVLKLQLEGSLSDAPSKLRGAIDPSIRGTFAYESLKIAVEITISCLSKDSSKRPSIEDVLWNLQYSLQVQDGWTTSGNLSTQF